ncbi:MAG: HRDC domain-containing protein [Candidatus Binatia bacterium]
MNQIESSKTPESREYIYIREAAATATLIERIKKADRVAVDTEADSLHNYFEKVCLIQLSLAGEHYLVDPLAELELGGFLDALAEKALILHGGDYDLRMLRASLGFKPRGEVFDTMIAAQLLGIEQIGLAALIERYFNIAIAKEGQKSDWSRRPLSESQLRYAVNDTRFLEPLADRLRSELNEKGRMGWLVESCRAMVESTARDNLRDPEDAWRIKGAGLLALRQLAYLRELWRWRDLHARRANLPSFKILGNEQLLELVRWAESHPGAPLQQGPKLPRNIGGSRWSTLQEAITRAAGMKSAQWPELRKRDRRQPPDADFEQRLGELREACARVAKELEIAASTVAPRAALEAITRNRSRSLTEIMETGGLLRWQAELVRDALEECSRSTQEASTGK